MNRSSTPTRSPPSSATISTAPETADTIAARAITDREEEILKLVAEGHSSKEIAHLLVISVKTVERHRANLLHKLGIRDRLELTRYAIRAGLIEP